MNTAHTATATRSLDLTIQAPRSPRCRLGGYAVLPRLLDKCRADIAGTIGEYHTNCLLDQEFLSFAGIEYAALRAQLEAGESDGEILEWIKQNAAIKRSPWEIDAWSEYQNRRSPAPQSELHAYFMSVLSGHSSTREDITTWPDLLDLDDYCSFGGAA